MCNSDKHEHCFCGEKCHCQHEEGNCDHENNFDFAESLKKMTNEGKNELDKAKEFWDNQSPERKTKIKKGLVGGLAVLGGIYALKKILSKKK